MKQEIKTWDCVMTVWLPPSFYRHVHAVRHVLNKPWTTHTTQLLFVTFPIYKQLITATYRTQSQTCCWRLKSYGMWQSLDVSSQCSEQPQCLHFGGQAAMHQDKVYYVGMGIEDNGRW